MVSRMNGTAPPDLGAERTRLDLVVIDDRRMVNGLARAIQHLERLAKLDERVAPREEYTPKGPIRAALENLREAIAGQQQKLRQAEEEQAVCVARLLLERLVLNGRPAKRA